MTIKKFESINVVPFIDIMLVLLVIVLTTATFVAKGLIPLDLAKAQNADNFSRKKELIITIDANNQFFFDKEKVLSQDIEKKLQNFEKNRPILINADKKIDFSKFVFVLDILKKHEYSNLGVITTDE